MMQLGLIYLLALWGIQNYLKMSNPKISTLNLWRKTQTAEFTDSTVLQSSFRSYNNLIFFTSWLFWILTLIVQAASTLMFTFSLCYNTRRYASDYEIHHYQVIGNTFITRSINIQLHHGFILHLSALKYLLELISIY